MNGTSYQFCPFCASRLVEASVDGKARLICSSCEFVHYQNPVPASGVVLVERGSVLLVQRKFEPRVGMWTLPAGFIEAGEDAPACAVREMREETNLDIELVRLFNVYSAFDDPRTAVVLVLYVGKRVGGDVRCGDDASDARFFELNKLPPEIAFRAHRSALADIRKEYAAGLV
jgi:ADP-ribose pyrophosphatase YjhB (NUDIX family)